jgi:hypothetical protein
MAPASTLKYAKAVDRAQYSLSSSALYNFVNIRTRICSRVLRRICRALRTTNHRFSAEPVGASVRTIVFKSGHALYKYDRYNTRDTKYLLAC